MKLPKEQTWPSGPKKKARPLRKQLQGLHLGLPRRRALALLQTVHAGAQSPVCNVGAPNNENATNSEPRLQLATDVPPLPGNATPARALVNPVMPSLWNLASPVVLAQVPPHIPQYFIEAVCYWHADYDPSTFMKYVIKAPQKLILEQCEHLWSEYESFWPEVFGGCDYRDRDIRDINSFDAIDLPVGEPIALCILIVNRYINYQAECAAYNRTYFFSPAGGSQE